MFEDLGKILKETDDLRYYYAAFHALIYGHRGETARNHCSRLSEWVPNVGLPRYRIKFQTDSLMPSKIIWELNLLCEKDKAIEDKLYSFFNRRVVKIGDTQYAVSDNKDGLVLSAFFLREILKKKREETGVDNDKLSGLIEFVVTNSEGADITDLRHILQAARMLDERKIRFPVLRKQLLTEYGGKAEISWDPVDPYNDIVDEEIEFSVHHGDKRAKSKNGNLSFEVTGSKLTFSFAQEVMGYTISHQLRAFVNKEVQITNPRVLITTNNKFPLKFPQTYKKQMKSDEHGFIHVAVSIEGQLKRPEYVALYLQEVQDIEERLTSAVPMKYHSKTNSYYAYLDLGNPDIIFPHSSNYKLVVFVGDRNFAGNVENEIGMLEITFRNQKDVNLRNHGFMQKHEDIIPVFEAKQNPNFMLSVIISCGFIALFFGLLTILGKYGYNFNLYPTGLKGTLNLIFIIVAYGGAYSLLFYLWIYERIVDILLHIFILFIVSLILGNLSISRIGKTFKVTKVDSAKVKQE